MIPTILLILLAVALFGGAVSAIFFFRKINTLHERVREKEEAIERTSKLLIEKNIELLDENINQQKMLATKDDFIAIASHQLRTPVTEVKWGLGAIFSQPELTSAMRTDLDRIFESAKKMARLIEDLLDFVTAEQGHTRIAVSPYEPDPIVRTTSERIAQRFQDRQISLTLALGYGGMIESIDADSLEMLVSNLVENAYLYTTSPGAITVRTKSEKDGALEVAVEDSGLGISKDMQERLFVKFRRGAEAQERNSEGSGLGLYIVKTLIDRAGGIVGFEPRIGGGSIFRFSLPSKGSPKS